MGYRLNTDAYNLFIQLEVGLREFLIQLIRSYGVFEWSNNFLGNIQRDTINEVVRRINEANQNKQIPDLADQYVFKLDRAKKEPSFKSNFLFHPFYYLNWTDIENLIRMKNNSKLIDEKIGKLNRETIIEILKPLNHLRNDIAHSRFISEENYIFIRASFEIISTLLPDFHNLISDQTFEKTSESLLNNLKNYIQIIESGKILIVAEIEDLISNLIECENSFWLNSKNLALVKEIKVSIQYLEIYRALRKKPGGLIEISKLKDDLLVNCNRIINLIYE